MPDPHYQSEFATLEVKITFTWIGIIGMEGRLHWYGGNGTTAGQGYLEVD